MGDHEKIPDWVGELLLAGCVAVGVLFAVVKFGIFVLLSVLWGCIFYWSYQTLPKRLGRLSLVLVLSFVATWYLVGPPTQHQGNQRMEGALFAEFYPLFAWVIQKLQSWSAILARPLQIGTVYWIDVRQLFYGGLLGGMIFGFVLQWKTSHHRGFSVGLFRIVEGLAKLLTWPVVYLIDRRLANVTVNRNDYIISAAILWMISLVIAITLLFFGTALPSMFRAIFFYIVVVGLVAGYHLLQRLPAKFQKEAVLLGKDDSKESFYLSDEQLNHHVQVLGASGFGKTNFLKHLLRHHIQAGKGLIFVDLKADVDMLKEIVAECTWAERWKDFQLFSVDHLEHSLGYNPCDRGNGTELRDRIIGSLTWSDPYYKKVAEEVLLTICYALVELRDRRGVSFSLTDIHRCLESSLAVQVLASLLPNDKKLLRDMLLELGNRMLNEKFERDLQGIRSDLGKFVHSEFGHLLNGEQNGIDLYQAIREQKIVYMLLNANKYSETAKSLGKMILQDLKSVAATIINEVPRRERRYCSIIVDEFSDFAMMEFAEFLSKARGSNIGIIVAHQELAQLKKVSPAFEDEVFANTSTKVVFSQSVHESVQKLAAFSGTRPEIERTSQTEDHGWLFGVRPTRMGTEKIVEGYVIHPNLIKNLRRGECYIMTKIPEPKNKLVSVELIQYPEIPVKPVWGILKSLKAENSTMQKPRLNIREKERTLLVRGKQERKIEPTPSSSTGNVEELF